MDRDRHTLVPARPVCAALLVAALLVAASATAQDPAPGPDVTALSLEQLVRIEVETVSAASRYAQKVTDAPASVSLITADEIRRHGYRTLADALRIVDRGDLTPIEMRGDWAGDFGQTQFLPSSYYKYAVDFDGDGRRDLVHSVPDVLASTANYLKGYGWQRGQRWNEGDPNFEAIRGWNKAVVYAKTIAAFAERLEGTSARAEEPRR